MTDMITANETVDFALIMSAIDSDAARDYSVALCSALDDRADYEHAKNCDNESIQKHIKSAREALSSVAVARFMIAANVDHAFINRAERVNAHYNIYAVQKVASVARAIAFDKAHNAINACVLKSMFKMQATDIEFTHALALAATCDKMPVKDARARSRLVRHTVSASTASTQASSTMNALITLNIVSETRSAANETCYTLNDNELVSALRVALTA